MDFVGILEEVWTLSCLVGAVVWIWNGSDAVGDRQRLVRSGANSIGLMHANLNIFGASILIFSQLAFLLTGVLAILTPNQPTKPVSVVLSLIFIVFEVAIVVYGIWDRKVRKAIVEYSIAHTPKGEKKDRRITAQEETSKGKEREDERTNRGRKPRAR